MSSSRTLLVTGGDPILWSDIGAQWVDRGWLVIQAHTEEELAELLAEPPELDVAILDCSRDSPATALLDWFRMAFPTARFILVQDAESQPLPGGVALSHPLNLNDLMKIVDALTDA